MRLFFFIGVAAIAWVSISRSDDSVKDDLNDALDDLRSAMQKVEKSMSKIAKKTTKEKIKKGTAEVLEDMSRSLKRAADQIKTDSKETE